jgi:hypothetical protein
MNSSTKILKPVAAIAALFKPATLVLILALPACQKCETCSYKYDAGNGQQETYTFPEVCGEKYKREAQEDACHTAAQMAGSTCVCQNS